MPRLTRWVYGRPFRLASAQPAHLPRAEGKTKETIDSAGRRALYLQSRLVNTQRIMKTRIINSSLILILAAWGVSFFTGCASMEPNKTTSLLSAAGFRMRTPQTAKEKELYAALPSNKLERGAMNGKVFYVFKDEKAGVEYVGGEKAHRRYEQLCTQLHVAQAPEEQLNDFFTRGWSSELAHFDYSG